MLGGLILFFKGALGWFFRGRIWHLVLQLPRSILKIVLLYCLILLVIAWVAVKFGINTTSVALKMGKISRGKAHFQCNQSSIYSKFYCYSQLIPYSMTVHYPAFSQTTQLPMANITNKICCDVLNTCTNCYTKFHSYTAS